MILFRPAPFTEVVVVIAASPGGIRVIVAEN